MKFKNYAIIALSALALGFTACGEDDDDPAIVIDLDDATIEVQKDFIGKTAEELSSLLDIESIHVSVDFLNYFAQYYGEVEEDDDYYEYPARVKRMASDYELIQFADMTGVYVWNGDEFVKTSDSNKCILSVPNDKKYGKIQIEVEASNDSQDWTIANDEDVRVDVRLPYSIKGQVTAGGKVMLSQTVTNSGRSGSNVTASTKTTLGGMTVEATGNATPTNATSKAIVAVNGNQIAMGNATLTGKNLTNSVKWADDDYEYLSDMISSGTFRTDVLGKIQLIADLKMSQAFEECDDWFSYGYSWSDYTKDEALKACKAACSIYNKAYSGYITFNNTSRKQAYLTFIPENYEYFNEWENTYCGDYSVVEAFKFADGTTYSDELFEGVFDRVIDTWEYLFY